MIYLIAVGAVTFTFLGGLFALKFRDNLHLILGFSSGAVIGVAFFDLMPEAIEILGKENEIGIITSVIALGFAGFMVLDRIVGGHTHSGEGCHEHSHTKKGFIGAGAFAIHSFVDGMAVGLAFQVSSTVGAVVALAVLFHNFSDGINTVGLILKGGDSVRTAFKWLVVDALAPAFGILSTLFFSVSEKNLGLLLAVFAGSFFYIGASDLLPESHHGHKTIWTTVATVVGMVVIYMAVRMVG